MKKIYARILKLIEENDSFVITSHINPDGDAIGSELGFYRALKRIGKNARIINVSETPKELRFLDNENSIEKYAARKHDKIIANADVHFFLDLNQISRTAEMQKIFAKHERTRVYIDHHQAPDEFANIMLIEPQIGSVGEMIFDFIEKTELTKIDFEIAEPLYAAIMTDTGSFRYERTTPKTHVIASKLLKTGIDPKHIYEMIYEQSTLSRLQILGKSLQTMKLYGNGKVCAMEVRHKDIAKYNGSEADIEGFVNHTLTVEGVRIGLLFFEFEKGFKVSYRSRGNIPVNKLAAEFGGGGHINAAGSRLEGASLAALKNKVIRKAIEYLKYDK